VVDEVMCTDVQKTDMSGLERDRLFITQKAYCIMFRNKHFKLQFHILSALLKIQKHELMEAQTMKTSNYKFKNYSVLPEYDDIIRQIETLTLDGDENPFSDRLSDIKRL
jgi:hypothetical protein